jgi:hypothetical protein
LAIFQTPRILNLRDEMRLWWCRFLDGIISDFENRISKLRKSLGVQGFAVLCTSC